MSAESTKMDECHTDDCIGMHSNPAKDSMMKRPLVPAPKVQKSSNDAKVAQLKRRNIELLQKTANFVQEGKKILASIGERSRSFHTYTTDIITQLSKISILEDIIRTQDSEIDGLRKELETWKEDCRMWKEKAENFRGATSELSKKENEATKRTMQDQAAKSRELEDRIGRLEKAHAENVDWRG